VRLGPSLLVLVAAVGCAKHKGALTVDEIDPDVPHRSLEATCAEFAPPSGDGAFVFAADAFDEKTNAPAGTLQVAIEAGTFHDRAAWFVDEKWEDAPGGAGGARLVKHARTWLAPDLALLSAVVDVDTAGVGGGVERLHSEFGPTAHGYWITVHKSDGSTTREESTSAGPSWARSFAGAMVFLRRCPAESALYAGTRGDYLSVRLGGDGTITVSGFASMSVTARGADRAPLSLHEHVWEKSPRRFEIRRSGR
jgi:hypothetical protein